MKFYTIFLILIVFVGTVQAAGKRKNLFEQGMDEHVGRLTAIFDPAIRALEICKQNLEENPAVSDFKSNFDLINCAYQKVHANIVGDQELLSEFIALHSTNEIKEKIEIIKKLFEGYYVIITHNNPSCNLIDNIEKEQKELLLTIKKFLDHKQFHDALTQGNMETLSSYFERKQEAFDEVEIAVEPDTADDEKRAQQLQLELNLELMYEREEQERSVRDNHHIHENLGDERTLELVEEIMSECPSAQQRGASIFSGATNDVQFIAELKEIIYGMDITKAIDQELLDRLTARTPNTFSMVMNREIGKAAPYDFMQYNFGEPHMTSYAHYFPECLVLDVESRVITLEGHTGCVYCIKQLNDGRLVSCSSDGIIKVWDLNTNSCIATFQQGNDAIVLIEELADGLLAFYSDFYSKTVWVWDFNSYRCVATYQQQVFSLGVITLTLNDGHRASGAFDSKVRIFSPNGDEPIGSCQHEGSVRCIQQLSDGRLASCSDDGTIKIWDLYPELSLEQIALVVHLERCRQQDKVVNLGTGWYEVLETFPAYLQKRFEPVVS